MLTATLLRRSLVFLCVMTALTCAYTGALTLAGKALFPFQAEGSIITAKGRQYSTLLGQPFTAANHLWGRPVSADTANVAGARGTYPAGAPGKIRPAHSCGFADGIRQRA